MLVETGAEPCRSCPGLPSPPDRTAVHVMDVEHLASGVEDSFLDRIADVRTLDRGRRIAKCVGTVGQRFVDPPGLLLGQRQPVVERLTAIVQCTRAGTVGAGGRVDLRQVVPVDVLDPEVLIADLVVEEHELAEGRRARRADHCIPTDRVCRARARIGPRRSGGFDDHGPEQPVLRLHSFVAVRMEDVRSFGF